MCSVVIVHEAAVVISRSQSTQIAMTDEHAEIGAGRASAVHRPVVHEYEADVCRASHAYVVTDGRERHAPDRSRDAAAVAITKSHTASTVSRWERPCSRHSDRQVQNDTA